jgi:hypothetical protein
MAVPYDRQPPPMTVTYHGSIAQCRGLLFEAEPEVNVNYLGRYRLVSLDSPSIVLRGANRTSFTPVPSTTAV